MKYVNDFTPIYYVIRNKVTGQFLKANDSHDVLYASRKQVERIVEHRSDKDDLEILTYILEPVDCRLSIHIGKYSCCKE
jgi:hypothetical protein